MHYAISSVNQKKNLNILLTFCCIIDILFFLKINQIFYKKKCFSSKLIIVHNLNINYIHICHFEATELFLNFKILLQRLQEEEWQRDMEWDRQRVNVAKAGTILEQRHKRMEEELRKGQDTANIHLCAEQVAQ